MARRNLTDIPIQCAHTAQLDSQCYELNVVQSNDIKPSEYFIVINDPTGERRGLHILLTAASTDTLIEQLHLVKRLMVLEV